MPGIVCMGEILIDMLSSDQGKNWSDVATFHRQMGGAPANVAVNASRLGSDVAFVGCVGADPFGAFLMETLAEHAVDISHMKQSSDARTTLAFAKVDANREASYVFFRHPGADMMLTAGDLDEQVIAQARMLHLGTFSLSQEPFRSAQMRAIELAEQHGIAISCDINFRGSVWNSESDAREQCFTMLEHSHIVKLTETELRFLAGVSDLTEGAMRIWRNATKLVVVTLGERGCFFRSAQGVGFVHGYKVAVGDLVGAGDGFMAGMLHYLSRSAHTHVLDDLLPSTIGALLARANAVAAIVVTEVGAVPRDLNSDRVERIVSG